MSQEEMMVLVGSKARMIVSDPWESFIDIKAIVQSSYIFKSRKYLLILEATSSERYLVTPRYLGIDLDIILLGRVVPVGIYVATKYMPNITSAELIHNSQYIGIGSIEIITDVDL